MGAVKETQTFRDVILPSSSAATSRQSAVDGVLQDSCKIKKELILQVTLLPCNECGEFILLTKPKSLSRSHSLL